MELAEQLLLWLRHDDLKGFRLTRYFIATAACMLVVAAVGISVIFARLTRQHVVRESQDDAVSLAIHIEQEIGPALRAVLAYPEIPGTGDLQNQLESELARYHDHMDVLLVRLYDTSGHEVFSDADARPGSVPAASSGFKYALTGQVWSKSEASGEIAEEHLPDIVMPAQVVETYLPIHSAEGEQIIGVLEVYRDVTADYQRAWRLQNSAVLVVSLAMAGLLTALSLIVRHGDRLLAEANRRFGNVLATTADAIICADETGHITLWNDAAVRMFGYPPHEVLGQPYVRLVAPEARERFQEHFPPRLTKALLQPTRSPIVSTAVRQDGTTFPVEISHAAYPRGSGYEFSAVVRDITERKQAEERLRNIAEGVSAATGEAFFRSLVRHLAEALGMDYAFVGELVEETDDNVRTIAVCAHGEIVDNFEYHLRYTPCENVVGKSLCSYPHGVQQLFPRDRLLMDMGIESYVGTPLFDSAGHALGLIVVLDGKPLSNARRAESMLQIFAVRAAAELERRQAEEEVRRRAAHLEALNAIIADAATAVELPALLETALDRLLQALGLEMGAIWLKRSAEHHAGNAMVNNIARQRSGALAALRIVRGLPAEAASAIAQTAQASDLDILGSIVVEDWKAFRGEMRGESDLPSDAASSSAWWPATNGLPAVASLTTRFDIQAFLIVPILDDGRHIGGISLAASTPRTWRPGEVALVEAVGRELGAAVERLRLFTATREHAELMSRLVPLSEALNHPLSAGEVVKAIGQGALALSRADRVAVYTRNLDDTFTCAWLCGFPSTYPDHVEANLQALPGDWLLEQPNPVLASDVKHLPADSLLREFAQAGNHRAFSLWPLIYEGRVISLVGCYYDTPHTWSEVEGEVLQAFARQAAVALENAQLYQNLESAYVETVSALANAMDARDAYTGDHSHRLAKWAVATARRLNCSEGKIEAIRWGALLHDIGKIGVPDCILQKPGGLNEQEWAIVKRHPQIGAEIVAPVQQLANVAPIIRAHQEKFDGSGYPDGRAGEEIPLGARIIAVVDAYSAITDKRPYKPARSHAEAVAELQRCAGTQFDPQVVDIFLKMMNDMNA